MKPSLASWGLSLLLDPAAAAMSAAAFAAKYDVGAFWGGYAKQIASSCYEDHEVATAERIFTTLLEPLRYETCLVKTSLGNRPTPPAAGANSKQYAGRVRRLCAEMKPYLASWGMSLVRDPAAVPSTVDCAAKPDAGFFWDGYVRTILASCYEGHEVATTERIFTTLFRPLLCETSLIKRAGDKQRAGFNALGSQRTDIAVKNEDPTDDAVRVLRGGGSDANTTHVTKASEDILRIVCEIRGGGVDHHQRTHITNTSFVVTGEQARDGKESTVTQCPRCEVLTENFHAQPQIEHDAHDGSSSSSSSSSITTTTTTSANIVSSTSTSTSCTQDSGDEHVNTSPSTITNTRGVTKPITSSANFIGRRGTNIGDTRNPENTYVYRGVEAALKASKERLLTPEVRLLSHRKVDMLNTIATKSKTKTPVASAKATRISLHSRVAKPLAVGVFWHPINPKPSKIIAESRSNLRRGSANNHLVIKSHSVICPRNPWVRKRTCSLQVGDASVGTLRSAEKRSKLWTEEADSPLRFQKRPALLPRGDAGRRGTQPGLMQLTNLMGSDRETSHKSDITLGETLMGTVRFAEEGVALWLRVDGFSRFGKHPAQPSLGDEGGKETGSTTMMSTKHPPGSESAHHAWKGVSSPKPALGGEDGNIDVPSSASEIARHVFTKKKTTLSVDDFETDLLVSSAEIPRNRLGISNIGLRESGGEGEGEGPSALQSKYMLSSDHEPSPAVSGTQKMGFRGTGDGGEEAVSRAKLPMTLSSADPETVRELLRTREIVLQGMSSEGEIPEMVEAQSMNMKLSDSDKGREVLATRTPVVQDKSGETNLLASFPEKVQEVLAMRREVLQEEDGKMFGSDPQKVPEVLSMQNAVHHEEGGKDSDSAGDRKKKVRGWLPWGKHPEEGRLNHLFAATTEMEGPMCVSEAKRGCVLETVDGAMVVSQSRHFTWDWVSRFPWKRPEDHRHRETLTEEKWEVRVGGRKVWGVSEKDWMG